MHRSGSSVTVVARSPDRGTAGISGTGDLRSARWHGRETVPQRGLASAPSATESPPTVRPVAFLPAQRGDQFQGGAGRIERAGAID